MSEHLHNTDAPDLSETSPQPTELSPDELVTIIGGLYLAQYQKPSAAGEVCTCPERCCGQHNPPTPNLCSYTLKK